MCKPLNSFSEDEIYKNYLDNLKLLEISSKTKCNHFIYISSVDVFKLKILKLDEMVSSFVLKIVYIQQKLISENIQKTLIVTVF